ncbi:MAG: PH domain-containing protein [Synergistaceae bacterium]|nr:PH domain-containing protein [Synergistaceae bacterium]
MEPVYKYYKPAFRSFYRNFLLMLLLAVLAGVLHYFKSGASWLKWMWIAVAVVEVLAFLYIVVKRATMSLILRDNPDKAEDQEVAFIVCHPLKPFSSDFRESVEIGLANIVHIKMGQTLMQTMLNIGDIVITSSGTGTEEIHAHNIPNPQAVRDEIQVHARKYTMPSQPSAPAAPVVATAPEA